MGKVNTNFGIWHGCKICKYLKRAYKIKAERLNKWHNTFMTTAMFKNSQITIAKQEIIKLSQDECFEEEKVILVSNRFLPKSSRMYV